MLTATKNDLFASDAVFISEETDKEAVIREVYQKLLDRGYVKGDFIAHILEREKQYPTGIDTSLPRNSKAGPSTLVWTGHSSPAGQKSGLHVTFWPQS